jgi:hypothetical protein
MHLSPNKSAKEKLREKTKKSLRQVIKIMKANNLRSGEDMSHIIPVVAH